MYIHLCAQLYGATNKHKEMDMCGRCIDIWTCLNTHEAALVSSSPDCG